jgi:N-acetylmuramoyl-L-alanine amidase
VIRIGLLAVAIALFVVGAPSFAGARAVLQIEDQLSPWSLLRPLRPRTLYIVLHTTESGGRSALDKLRLKGEAHYLVETDGRVFRIVEKNKVAKHAGLSLWEGRRTLDNYSIGIEVVGYLDREFGPAQLATLRELIRQLRTVYRLPTRNVVTHSMVAYGRPNRFQHGDHRGRKRCGMVFARPRIRELLGLDAAPVRDPDVERGVLTVGDQELFDYLFPPAAALPGRRRN